MTDAEAADAATMQAFQASGGPPSVTQAPLPAMPKPAPAGKPVEPPPVVTGVSVPSAEQDVTGADINAMQDFLGLTARPGLEPSGAAAPPPSPMVDVTQKLPEFQPFPGLGTEMVTPPPPPGAGGGMEWRPPGTPAVVPPSVEVPKLDITTGTKLGPMTYANDAATMDNFITERQEETSADRIQRARELSQAYARREINLSPDWLHDIAQTLAASNPSSYHTLEQAGGAMLDIFGVHPEDYSGSTAAKVGAALLQYPRTYWALTKAELAALGKAGSAIKTLGQAAWEYPTSVVKGEPQAQAKSEITGVTKGLLDTLPMLGDVSQFIEGLTGQDRTDTIEQTLRVRNRLAGAEGRQEHWLGYDPKQAPATRELAEFVGGSVPFAVAPEIPGLRFLGEAAGKAASTVVEPLVTRAEPLAAAAIAKTAPPLAKTAATLAVEAPKAAIGYAAGEMLGHGPLYSTIGGLLGLVGKPTVRMIVNAFKGAPAEAADAIGPYLAKAMKNGRPLTREMQLGVESDIARLTRQQQLIRDGADELTKTDAKMADGSPVFRADEIKKNAVTVRDEITAQQAKATSLGNWAKFERLATDTVTASAAATARAVPSGIVLGGVNAL